MKGLMLVVVLVMLCSVVYGVNPDSINLTVSPITNISVNIGPVSYDFGTVALGATTVNSSAITVTNDGNVSTGWEDSATNTTSGDWTLTTGVPGANQFRLCAKVQASQPAQGAFDPATTDIVNLYAANYTTLTGASASDPVTATGVRNLWLRLELPPTSASGATQTITYYIRAFGL